MRRRLRSRSVPALAALAGTLVLAGAAAAPCAACSCAEPGPPAQSARVHDVVLVGTLVDRRRSPVRVPGMSGSQEWVAAVFDVTEVRKGEASRRTEILTDLSGASCGMDVEAGVPYVVVADETPEGLTSALCDGSRPLSAVTPAQLAAVGPPVVPAPGTRSADLPVLEGSVVPVLRLLVLPVLAVVALLAATWLVLRRRRRRALR